MGCGCAAGLGSKCLGQAGALPLLQMGAGLEASLGSQSRSWTVLVEILFFICSGAPQRRVEMESSVVTQNM